MGLFSIVITTLSYSGILIIFWKGGSLVINNTITPGDLSSFMLIALSMSAALARLDRIWMSMLNSLAMAERLFTLLDK